MPAKPIARVVAAVLASLAVHGLLAAALMGSSLVRLWPRAPAVEIEVVTTPPEALPLGPAAAAPPAAPAPAEDSPAPTARKKRVRPPRPPADAGVADAGDIQDALPAANTDAQLPSGLRAEGPEGARLVVRLRLDRLREAPRSQSFARLADALLQLLPDRKRLLEGSGIDLFADFDAMVIATPNPLDDAVTFLAVRHHLGDEALMNALGRAATASGRPIQWQAMRGRPVGMRNTNATRTRDDRLFVLPEPGWAVIAPQAYVHLLLPELSASPDAPAAPETFSSLTARIRGEEAVMPSGAVLTATMADMLAAKAGQTFSLPGVGQMPLPKTIATHIALTPQPEVEVRLGFVERAAAARWAAALPDLRQQYAVHPLVVLGGMGAVVSRITVQQVAPTEASPTGASSDALAGVVIKAPMSHEEAERILTLIANLLRGAGGQLGQ